MPDGFMKSLRDNPATGELGKALSGFAVAQVGNIAGKVTGKGEDSPEAGAAQGSADAQAEGRSGIWGGIKGALKKMLPGGGSAKRPTNIYEQIFLGVPVEVAYQNWTQYSKFPEYMKGPESVKVTEEEGEDGEVKQTQQWTAKIFLNRRSWKATVEEDLENYRIKWSTEAAKGTVDGVVTFHAVTEDLTLMVYVLEYRPKGFFEWWGNRWRTVGRRARLDVKHFGRHVMMLPAEEDEREDADEDLFDDEPLDPEEEAEVMKQEDDNEEDLDDDTGESSDTEEPEQPRQSERAERSQRRPRTERAART